MDKILHLPVIEEKAYKAYAETEEEENGE